MTALRCPLCETGEHFSLLNIEDFVIRRCHDCEFAFIVSTSHSEKISYARDYYASWGIGCNGHLPAHTEKMKGKTFVRKLDQIEKFCQKGRVLDVGCATGIFLETARARGWDICGCDVSNYAIKTAREKLGDSVLQGDIFQPAFGRRSFDLITLFDVLEHFEDLSKACARIREILRSGGILAIVTPSLASFSAKIMGTKWINFKREHLHYFSPKSIEILLTGFGFEILSLTANVKYLNLNYVQSQLSVYEVPVLSGFFRHLGRFIPSRIKSVNFPFYTGEMFLIARKLK